MKIERELKRDKRWDLEEKNIDFEMDTSTINSENAWIQTTVHSNNNNSDQNTARVHLISKEFWCIILKWKRCFTRERKKKENKNAVSR